MLGCQRGKKITIADVHGSAKNIEHKFNCKGNKTCSKKKKKEKKALASYFKK